MDNSVPQSYFERRSPLWCMQEFGMDSCTGCMSICRGCIAATTHLVCIPGVKVKVKVKVKQSHYRPGVAQRVPGS